MSGRAHPPLRPLWLCRTRVTPWPCEEARRQLLAAYAGSPTMLGLYLVTMMIEADRQLTTLHPYTAPPFAVLYDRFMGWLPPRPSAR